MRRARPATRFPVVLILVAAAFPAVPAVAGDCALGDGQCQEPDIAQFPGGPILTAAPTADNFTAAADGTVTQVCFWGAYIDPSQLADCDVPAPADAVTVTFFPNLQSLPPQPDTSAATSFVIPAADLTRVATGLEFDLGGFEDTVSEYQWTATLPAPGFAVSAGECYWIEVENAVTSGAPDCAWFWELSPEVVNDPEAGEGDDFSWDLDFAAGNDFDLAWCVDVAMGDAAGCFLPLDPACGEMLEADEGACVAADGTSCVVVSAEECAAACPQCTFTEGEGCLRSCNVASPFGLPGCLEPECCTLICAGDDVDPDIPAQPECCSMAWDVDCAQAAVDRACVPVPPCGVDTDPGSCQQFGTADALPSTTGNVDPAVDTLAADDFTPVADGALSSLCWQGLATDASGNPLPPDFPNDFAVAYHADAGGVPGAVIAGPFAQSDGTLMNVTVQDTNQDLAGIFPILEYTASHEPVVLTAGECLWLSIRNDVGEDGSNWHWSLSATSAEPPFFAGNGRLAVRAGAAGGTFEIADLVGGADFAFCLPDLGPLSAPACGLDTLFNTGAEELVTFNGAPTYVGWGSGQLCDPQCGAADTSPQRRTVQAFTLPPGGAAGQQSWRIGQILVDGFTPSGVNNETLAFEIFVRQGLERPTPGDSLVAGEVPFASAETGFDNPQGGFAGGLHAIHADFDLPPGDYWLTVWAANTTGGGGFQDEPSSFAWLTNAPDGIENFCPAEGCVGPTPEDEADGVIGCADEASGEDCATTAGEPMMWRCRHWPDGAPGDPAPGDGFGFGSARLPPEILDVAPQLDPTPDPASLYNTAFMIRGGPGGVAPCPWDCAGDDEVVGTPDFLELLAQWGGAGDCDFDGGGVGVTDFLALLANWGVCPPG